MPGRKLRSLFVISIALLFSACGTVTYERSHIIGFEVSNRTLGRGVAYKLPPGYAALDPVSGELPKLRNQGFENYLRAVTLRNEEPNSRHAFNECLLFRQQDRYVVVFHAAINFPSTFDSLPPEERARVLPILANEARLFFATPNKDYRAVQTERQGNTVIEHLSFLVNAAGPAGHGWVGTGFSFVGDVTDVVAVFVFAPVLQASAAQSDREFILDHFRYGTEATK